jgi:hypothetical protein
MGIALVSVAALVIVLMFFITQKRRGDAAWERYRERHRKRQERPRNPEPPDPNLRFDKSE